MEDEDPDPDLKECLEQIKNLEIKDFLYQVCNEVGDIAKIILMCQGNGGAKYVNEIFSRIEGIIERNNVGPACSGFSLLYTEITREFERIKEKYPYLTQQKPEVQGTVYQKQTVITPYTGSGSEITKAPPVQMKSGIDKKL